MVWVVNPKERWCVRADCICAISTESWRDSRDTYRILHTTSGQVFSVQNWLEDLTFVGLDEGADDHKHLRQLFLAIEEASP